jgi:CTP:molybdopterin cytidylyltransferase MocA
MRMGFPKALLASPDEQPFVARVVTTLTRAGVDRIAVVTGRDHDAIAAALSTHPYLDRVALARNPDPSRGQLSSLWTGMDAVDAERAGAVLVTLVDVPMVAESTVRIVMREWERTHAPIVRPAIGDRHGHPVIFDRSLFAALRAAPLDAGAKAVVRANESRIVNVVVDDEGCLVDIDTREDYLRLGSPGS